MQLLQMIDIVSRHRLDDGLEGHRATLGVRHLALPVRLAQAADQLFHVFRAGSIELKVVLSHEVILPVKALAADARRYTQINPKAFHALFHLRVSE